MVRNDANTNPHRRAEKVQMSATTLRVAPIRTCPAPAAEPDLLGDEIQTPRTNIRAAGGVAFVARDCRDVLRTLGEAQAP